MEAYGAGVTGLLPGTGKENTFSPWLFQRAGVKVHHRGAQCEVSWEILHRDVVLWEDSSPGDALGAASFGIDFQRTNFFFYFLEMTKEVKVSWVKSHMLPLASL